MLLFSLLVFCIATVCSARHSNSIFGGENFIETYLSRYATSYSTIVEKMTSKPWTISEYHQRGIDLYMEQKYELASDAFHKVLISDPTHADALFHLGLIQKQLGHFQRAGELYQAAVSFDSSHVKAHLNYATLHHSFGNVEEALTQYKYAIYTIYPNISFSSVLTKLLGVPADVEFIAMLKTNLITGYYQVGNYTSVNHQLCQFHSVLRIV